LTAEECHSLPVSREESTPDDLNTHYIPFERVCRDECPYGFEVTADKRNCTLCTKTRHGHCQRNCNSFKISDDMLRKNYEYRLHTNCTTIKSLEIEVKYGTSEDVERRLEEYIGKVEVILDQLKIIRSYSLSSLNFLRSLYEIRGENTVNKMALVIRGNKNLQKLWTNSENETRPVKILNGTVSFHYNPKLCMSEIYKFGNLSTLPAFSDIEVSVISNGDQFACTVYNLQVDTVKIEPQSIVLQMHKPVEADHLERFLVYFIEASKWNETIETTDCEDSSWKIDDISSKKVFNDTEIYHVITNLEPNTEYIYYVKTYTISSKTSMSSIFRSKTLPSKPSAPQYFAAQPLSSSAVELTWKPPSHPHGKLVKYIIKGIHLTDDQAILDERSYCRNKTINGNGITHKSSQSIVKPSDDTCEKQCEPQKNIVNNICNTFEHGIDLDLISLNNHRYTFESCSSNILNIFINSKCLAMQNNDDTIFPNIINENCTEMWSVSNIVNNVTHKDGSSSYFQIQLNENVTSFNLSNLRHYSQYLLSILVCREVVKQELNLSNINACSQETLISFRTLENKQADIIDSDSVQDEVVNNHTVIISWEPPILINSILHSFQLEYKRSDAPNFVSVCITMKEYENAGRSYVFKNLQPGVYQYKIQAVSLYKPGPFTAVKEFNLPYPDSFNSWNLILIIFICGCILIVLTIYYIRTHFSRKILERNTMFNLANNPGYVGIYVEDEFELPREDVIIQKILGRGTFGTVHEGLLMPDSIPCAVKSVSKTNFLRYHAEFLNEAAIMKKFSEAYHIVRLLGVVTKTHPPLLVMELMGRGDLKSVLVKCKNSDDPPPPNR
jgi:insulin receptor